MIFSKELLQAAHDLELVPRRDVSALLSGGYKSPHRGAGMQFKEFRPYEPGDDVRHMSWSVTARTGKATVKVYEEERELNVIVMVDISGSSLFGHGKKRRVDIYSELIALFGLSAINQGNNFGLLLFDNSLVQYLPPRKTRHHVFTALKQLEKHSLEKRQSDLRPVLKTFSAMLTQPALVLVLSDFFVPDFSQELSQFGARHDVVLMHAKDSMERGEGIREVFEVWNPETGEFTLLDGASIAFRKELGKEHRRHREELVRWSHSANSDYFDLDSHENYLHKTVEFFRTRRRPGRAA